MTDEAKRFLNLKEDVQALREIEWTDCAMNPRVCTTMMHKAADLIESLAAELEQVKRERDAAVEEWKQTVIAGKAMCDTCKFSDDEGRCFVECDDGENWQWRGVKDVPGLLKPDMKRGAR